LYLQKCLSLPANWLRNPDMPYAELDVCSERSVLHRSLPGGRASAQGRKRNLSLAEEGERLTALKAAVSFPGVSVCG
jgi:hypothetical protein